jgi:hypothetical protein
MNKSGAQRDDANTSNTSNEDMFYEPVNITVLQRDITLTWVVYIAQAATLKYCKVQARIRGINTHNKQE